MLKTGLLTVLILSAAFGWAQTFPVYGQLPATAFPVCGSNTFSQETVPEGSTHSMKVPGCGEYPDTNPFWYSFTCFTGGTLGFLITPNNILLDDYDWMLFDITGRKPDDVYTDVSLVVTGSWVGTYGLTGAKKDGLTVIGCASDPAGNILAFSTMPVLIKGHQYLLLVSHYTDSQSGYSLSFGGGTADITDPTVPSLKSASIACNRKSVTVVLGKQTRCSSLVSDGSDFAIASHPGIITAASPVDCNGFDMDSVEITLNSPLPPGNYSIVAKKGIDGNTLLDDCGTEVPVNDNASFTVLPPLPTPFDSLTTPACAPNIVQLVFTDPIQCSSIAPDGSDFTVTGPPGVSIAKAEGVCTNGLSQVINITFTAPVVKGGNYLISLVTGSDGNAIINECGVETPAGGKLSFFTKDTVSAGFEYKILYGCKMDTISLNYLPANGVYEWHWNIDSALTSELLDLQIPESVFSQKSVQHIVTNGFCSDTVIQIVDLDNSLKANFQAPDIVCPKDVLPISNNSIGKIISWNWNFGDGSTSIEKDPPAHLFPDSWVGKNYTVSLIIENNLGCLDSLSEQITRLQSCVIAVPNAFSPDGNGKNDFLYPLNAFMATNVEFRVFNRFGQMVFESKDWNHRWDGKINGEPQPVGTYVWTLRYTDSSGKKFSTRGTSVLIR